MSMVTFITEADSVEPEMVIERTVFRIPVIQELFNRVLGLLDSSLLCFYTAYYNQVLLCHSSVERFHIKGCLVNRYAQNLLADLFFKVIRAGYGRFFSKLSSDESLVDSVAGGGSTPFVCW